MPRSGLFDHEELKVIPVKRVAAGSALLVLASLLIAACNYALSIILSWMLFPAAYGAIGVSQGFIFLGTWFLAAGFPWITTQALAKAGPEKIASTYPVIKGALLGNLLLNIALAGGLWLAAWTGLLPLGAAYRPLITWAAIVIFLLGLRLVFDAVLQGVLRFDLLALVRGVEVIGQFGVALLLVAAGYGASGALAGFAFGTAISLFLGIWLTRDVSFWRGRGFGRWSDLRPALPFLLANLSGVLMVNIDLLALKFLASPAQADLLVGRYQAAVVLARIPYFCFQAILLIVFPLIARQAKDSALADYESRRALRVMITAVLAINVLLIAAPGAVISFFFPPAYLAATPALRLLALAMGFIILAQTLASIMQARGQALLPAVLLPLAVLAQILAALWWIPRLQLTGTALASCVAGLVAAAVMFLAARRTFSTLIQTSKYNLVKQLLAFGLLALTLNVLPMPNRLLTVIWVVAGAGAYALALLALRIVDLRALRSLVQGILRETA